MSLGTKTKTDRGFEIIQFRDTHNAQCTLQQSSAYDGGLPGTSRVWLGVHDPELRIMKSDAKKLGLQPQPDSLGDVSGWMRYPIPKEVMLSSRMHLDREQVVELIAELQCWLDTGNFKAD